MNEPSEMLAFASPSILPVRSFSWPALTIAAVFEGDQVAIDELSADRVTYESMCAEDYRRQSGGRLG